MEIAEPYAAFLGQNGYDEGFVYLRSPGELEESCKTANKVEVRPVGLGGCDYDDFDGVDADNDFNVNGRARGVVHVEPKNFRRK